MKCFVIMPFSQDFDHVFELVKSVATTAVPETQFECYWLKDVHAAGRITDDILSGINEAAFCIADVSGHNPNVMWETGYAMALGKPTILIGRDIAALPFDLKSHRVLGYSSGNETQFRDKLAEAIRQTLARYALKGSGRAELPSMQTSEQRTIAVTGTMTANEAVACRRLQRALTPFLSETTTWLAGSGGNVDIAAIRFLVERNQRVVAVGYHRFDCAPELRRLIEEGKLSFLDASVESIPRGMSGPNQREILFCMKSDLVILLWDGHSSGTKTMVQYFQSQGVGTQLVFL
jgi:nucleoside 2-deoxyribosyltransferase